MKILLVDDSKMMRSVQRKMLEKLTTQFFEAGDGIEALQTLQQHGGMDLIIVDWNMPKMDGITMVKAVRTVDKNVTIIMCTTEVEKPRIIEALKAGVNNYIVKPFPPETFVQKISQELGKKFPHLLAAA